jgi:hypothetical protein
MKLVQKKAGCGHILKKKMGAVLYANERDKDKEIEVSFTTKVTFNTNLT